MRLLHSRNSWYYHQGADPTIDFCIWVLQVDGLHVPPFDGHPDGDGSLRKLGLTAHDWQTWFLRVLDPEQKKSDEEQLRQLHMAEYLKIANLPDMESFRQRYQAERLNGSVDPPLPPLPPLYHYHASWRGNLAIKDRLLELEKQYTQDASQRARSLRGVEGALGRGERKATTRLYDDLKPYHNRLPPMQIYLATYAYPLDYLIAPATLLVTIQEGQPDYQEFRERAFTAVVELATHSDRRRGPSMYTRQEGLPGQSVALYRRHERKAVPPPLPRQEMPRLSDPLKQMILEELGDDEHMSHEIVDLATVQFVREKQRPGWKLYEITYQEIDGASHRMTYLLRQDADGTWRWNGGGTSSDMQNQWSKIFAPVRDHPLIFLGTQWTGGGEQQYLQTSYGPVIDNGFQVERVRLVNEAGQTQEDSVEDGYVFFACQPGEQVRLPMQAELYDRQGKLVWRQKIPENGLPPWLKLKHQH